MAGAKETPRQKAAVRTVVTCVSKEFWNRHRGLRANRPVGPRHAVQGSSVWR